MRNLRRQQPSPSQQIRHILFPIDTVSRIASRGRRGMDGHPELGLVPGPNPDGSDQELLLLSQRAANYR